MNPPVSPFAAFYNVWLDVFRSMIPGGPATPSAEVIPKAAQVVAVQKWEDEGGSIKPDNTPEDPPPSRIPL